MEGLKMVFAKPYDAINSPDGCINLGSAENELMFGTLADKFSHSKALTNLSVSDIRYGDFVGLPELRNALAELFNAKFGLNADKHVLADDITVHNGCGSAVEALFHVLCDAGDSVMIPSPYYGGFDMDLERRANVKIVPVQTTSPGYEITSEQLEATFTEYHEKGHNIRALLFVNPNNPLGIVYDEKTIKTMLDFCKKHNIHFVMDEIYAFSIFKKDSQLKFKSILHLIDNTNKDFVHLLWGFSKDFCINGLRAGVVVSKNSRVIQGLKEISYFTGTPSVTQKILFEIVSDKAFCDGFMTKNHILLQKNCDKVTALFQELRKGTKRVRWLEPEAGFFLWIDFSEFLSEKTLEQERLLFREFLDAGVYIAPGAIAFHSHEYGWFRIIFSANEKTLDLALERISKVLRLRVNE
jgi:aspartate/methionine/tyrosine aminotransferase